MKRTFASICALFLLASCIQQGALPPEQVLQKATEASGTLNSAHFVLHATVDGDTDVLPGSLNGNIDANGDMQNGGNQLSLSLNANLKRVTNASNTFNLQADVIVAAQNDVYMKLDTLTVNPESPMLPSALITQLLNQWWHLPSGSGATVQANVTPDPDLLRMQTQVISIAKDDGMTSIDGHNTYHYDVTIDHDKLQQYVTEIQRRRNGSGQTLDLSSMNAQGQIWIDADTFYVRQLIWNLSSSDGAKPFHATITVNLSKQNEPMTITPPADAKPFPIGGLTNLTNISASSVPSGN